MRAPALIVDIETRADTRLLDDPTYHEETTKDWANAAIKDPLKLEAWKGDKWEKHVSKMALHPTTGRVVCIGVAPLDKNGVPAVLCDMGHEAMVLADFYRALEDMPQSVICGHNVRKFDIPFLTARAAINDIELPDWWPFIRDWHNVADTMDVLGADGTLSAWCRAFGIPCPDVTGADTLKLSRTELIEHCSQDVAATRHILQKIARRFPCLRPKKSLSTFRL